MLGGASIACEGKILYDYESNRTVCDDIRLTQEDLEQKYLGKWELPRKIKIDACSMCQLNCPRCFMRMYPKKVKNGCGLGYLKFKDFKKIVNENDFKLIELSNNGEIFLNPELLDIIKYADKKGVDLSAYTGVNLNYLPDKIAEALVKYKFYELTVSIDAATPETYKIYRRGGDFDTVINNIKKINYYKKKYNSEYPIMEYKFILFGHNEHEIDMAMKMAKKLNMKMYFVPNFYPDYSPVKNIELVKEKTGVDVSKLFNEEMASVYQQDHKNWWFCKDLWSYPQINWDGKVLGCCRDYDGNFGGNAFKDGLLKALNHPKMIYAKNMVANGAKPVKGIPCTNCNILELSKKMNLTVKPQDMRGEQWF